MNRIFGSAAKKPKPTLTDAISNAETRIEQTEVKIRKLDAELARYKDQLKRLRNGPGKVCCGCNQLGFICKVTDFFLDGGAAARVASASAEEDVSSLSFQANDVGKLQLIIPHTHRYESQLGTLQQQSFNMEQASMTTDNLRNTMATVEVMKSANKEMKKQYGKLDIDKIEVRVLHVR
jgi:charged multivesicular body protein 5